MAKQPNTNLRTYYHNAAGVNFTPEYWDLFPFGANPDSSFSGMNCPLAMWRFYTESAIDKHMAEIRSLGMNCIRVWHSFYAWRHYWDLNPTPNQNEYCNRLRNFLKLAEKNKLHIAWTFWDNLIASCPGDRDPWDCHDYWYQVPNNVFVAAYPTVPYKNAAFMSASGFTFLEDVVPITASSQATVIYEMCNEAAVDSADVCSFIVCSVKKVRQLDPNPKRKTSAGFIVVADYSGTQQFLNQSSINSLSDINLLSIHPYWTFSGLRNKFMSLAASNANTLQKPVFATETANLGFFQTWDKCIDEITPCGYGWLVYPSVVGAASGNLAFRETRGLFHPTGGKVRRFSDASSIRQYAIDILGKKERHLSNPQEETDYPVNAAGQASRRSVYRGDHRDFLTSAGSWTVSGKNSDFVIASIKDWNNRTNLVNYAQTCCVHGDNYNEFLVSGAYNLRRPGMKQTELLYLTLNQLLAIGDISIGVYGTGQEWGVITHAEDLALSSLWEVFKSIRMDECTTGCLTSVASVTQSNVTSTYYDPYQYDTCYGVMGTYCSGVLTRLGWIE